MSIFLRKSLSNQRGQLVVEYVLLLVIAVAIATLITTTLVSRNTDNPGILTGKWLEILNVIGEDLPDKN